jgi:cytochrome c556
MPILEDFMRKLIFAISALALAGTAALADPIADRQALMKSNGKAAGMLAPMVKGEKPFDAEVVLAALTTLNQNAQKIDVAVLFPAGTDKGGDTTASPKIWEDMSGFQAKMDKFKADAAAAVAAPAKDLEALKAQFGMLGQNCGGCHETFRVKKG